MIYALQHLCHFFDESCKHGVSLSAIFRAIHNSHLNSLRVITKELLHFSFDAIDIRVDDNPRCMISGNNGNLHVHTEGLKTFVECADMRISLSAQHEIPSLDFLFGRTSLVRGKHHGHTVSLYEEQTNKEESELTGPSSFLKYEPKSCAWRFFLLPSRAYAGGMHKAFFNV